MPAAPESEYREQPPPPALAPWALCAWTWRAGAAGRAQRVVPDGCVDLVWVDGTGLHVAGANTTAFLATVGPRGLAAGVRLRPGAAPPLLGVAAEALRDARVPVAELWGAGPEERAAAAPGPAALWAELGRRLPAAGPDPLVRAAVARIERPVGRVADELGVGKRQLRRRVTAAVGYGPKRLGRVLRLQRALAAVRAGEELAAAAYGAGYADQAHFSGECRALAGVSPRALR